MIGKLSGTLAEKNPPQLLVDCLGVGYEVEVPMSTFFALGEVGQPVTLLTHLVVREDAHVLFGFATASERAVFRQLIRISGVGPRTALAVLSGLTVDDIGLAISAQDSSRLVKVPGIGKKTAERLLLELKDKWNVTLGLGSGATLTAKGATGMGLNDTASDVLQALVALGYSDREAASAVKKLPEGLDVSLALRHALRELS